MTLAHEPSASPNPFAQLRALGYPHLVPIVPPDAPVSERSTLAKRVGTDQDARGKVPGIRGRDGKWFSFDWVPHVSDETDDVRWHAMGAGAGIKTGNGLIALDADTLDQASANLILRTVTEIAGTAPCRVGRAPKALYVFRTDEEIGYQRIEFGPRAPSADGKPGRLLERLEVLSDGRQFVAAGIHPKTHAPYRWFTKLPAFEKLPVLSSAQLARIFDVLRSALPSASPVIAEGGGHEVAQEALIGDPAKVMAAVAALPNTSSAFPSRESYLGVGYAIKAAMGGAEAGDDGLEVWAEWCSRWDSGVNDRDVLEADWRRMKGPFRRGASWLYETAERESGGAWKAADAWFENLGPAPHSEPGIAAGASGERDLKLWSISELDALPDPRWLIARHLPDVSMGFLYGKPSAGKSFLALDMALSIAAGFPTWHGDKIDSERRRVVYIAAEGKRGMRNRIAAWRSRQGLDAAGAALLEANFALIAETINFMKAEDVGLLLRKVREAGERPSLLVVDTVSRMLPGADENLQKDMTIFIRACDAAKDAFECAVIGIHHSSKDGGAMRGSSVLLGAGDFVFLLERKEGPFGDLFCEKQKDGPDRWHDAYAFSAVATERGESLVVARAKTKADGSISVDGMDNEILTSMRAAWNEGSPWTPAPQGRDRHAIKRMGLDFGLSRGEAEKKLRSWLAQHIIAVEIQSSKMRIRGYKVADGYGQAVQISNIFG